jgi:hypothetical protein
MADLEISRFPYKERPYMPGSQTTPDRSDARTIASARFAFRLFDDVGIRESSSFAAQWLAYTLPYRRFADLLAEACARLGPMWVATRSSYWTLATYSLPVSPGLPAH